MPKYLSQEWLDEFRSLAQDQPTRRGATVKIQYQATGGPDGIIDYYWVLDEGRIADAKLGAIPDADLTITSSYDDAAAMQRGELDPNSAFLRGKLKAKGNLGKMMSLFPITNSPEWKELQEKVAAITEY